MSLEDHIRNMYQEDNKNRYHEDKEFNLKLCPECDTIFDYERRLNKMFIYPHFHNLRLNENNYEICPECRSEEVIIIDMSKK